jgi:hypothetical protein
MKRLLTTFIVILQVFGLFSQEETTAFKPSGKPFIRVYTNFHSTFSDEDRHDAFEIQRAYFGYDVNLSENISGRVTLDVANPGVGKLKMTAMLKNAYFQYRKERFTAKFGLIGLHQFKLQESQWGGRYLYKSFQDEHRFGPSADLGLYVSYMLIKGLTIDATIANGEGYKSLEADSLLKYSAGVTIAPVEGLDLHAYYDIMGRDDNERQILSFYGGWSAGSLKVGAEYNQQLNSQMTEGLDLTGVSFYGSYSIKKTRIFGRFDKLSSAKLSGAIEPWNIANDGQLIIAGIEFNPVRGLKITPNYQGWNPSGLAPDVDSFYLSCEIRF